MDLSTSSENETKAIHLPKWTSRGTAKCYNCGNTYSTARKPKFCEGCKCELGGSYKPKPKRHAPQCVVIYTEKNIQIFSVKTSTRDDRCLVVKDEKDQICHHESCKTQRAMYVNSSLERKFTCKHIDIIDDAKPEHPIEEHYLNTENITCYPADKTTIDSLLALGEELSNMPAVLKVSDRAFVVYSQQTTSTPLCYVHVYLDKGKFICQSKSCRHKLGNTKQIKSKRICIHEHMLFCLNLVPSPESVVTPLSNSTASYSPPAEEETPSISRIKTVEMYSNYQIPYPLPSDYVMACRKKDACTMNGLSTEQGSWDTVFEPTESKCQLCGSALSCPKIKPGSNGEGYLLTNHLPFHRATILVKFCENSECRAMHRVWPIKTGLFNVNDKLLLALDILIQWRELFRRGVPVKVFIESTISQWQKTLSEDAKVPTIGESYLVELLYNGFYCFESMAERSFDSVVCGICGVSGKVYYGDGNAKNCCELRGVDFTTDVPSPGPVSLEDFLQKIKKYWVEKTCYTKSVLVDGKIQATSLPPIIAPVARGSTVHNTEMEKKSIYLKDVRNNKFNGDQAKLHNVIKTSNLDINEIESLETDAIKEICNKCDIKIPGNPSKSFMAAEIRSLYASLLVGNSPCHEYTKVRGHTGGFYHIVCPHGTTVGSKFITLQESVRDAADIYLSLKYPPLLFVCDTPCTFARHVDLRDPETANMFWGSTCGCFEEPDSEKQPKEVSIPCLVPSEFQDAKIQQLPDDEGDLKSWQHPESQSARRYVVGDRFHSSTNPHKSVLCKYHDIDLCTQTKALVKTSYQESENNRKNSVRLQSATTQKFLVHFHYNYLMDFYQNESQLEKLKQQMKHSLKPGEVIVRGPFHKLVIV